VSEHETNTGMTLAQADNLLGQGIGRRPVVEHDRETESLRRFHDGHKAGVGQGETLEPGVELEERNSSGRKQRSTSRTAPSP